MSRKVFTCFIVIFFFLNKAASYGQEFQVSRGQGFRSGRKYFAS